METPTTRRDVAIHNSAGDWIRKARITSSSSPGPRFVTSNSLLRRMASVKMTIICVAFLAFYFALFSHVQAIECYFDSDCGYSKYCCIRGNYDNVCRHNCIGESCQYNSNCATGESCCYATKKCALNCVGKSCWYDSECGAGESCCDSTRKCAKICFGESCSSDSDCATGESCCTGSYKLPEVVLENRVLTMAIVLQENLVVQVLTHVPEVVLENHVLTTVTVLRENLVVKVLQRVTQIVSGNRVRMIAAARPKNVAVSLMANVNQKTVKIAIWYWNSKVQLVGLLLSLFLVSLLQLAFPQQLSYFTAVLWPALDQHPQDVLLMTM